MMINCIIIDDEPLARNLLEEYVEKVPYLNLIGSFSSGLKALDILKTQRVDLLFLDIQMPEINGITFLKSLQHSPNVIFTTAYAEFALEGFELDATDYLLKPFDFPRFLKAVEKITTPKSPAKSGTTSKEIRDFIFVKDGHSLVKVTLADIIYIKGEKDYVQIVAGTKKIMSLLTLKELSKTLPSHIFSRIHNSYIVNLSRIHTIEHNQVTLEEMKLPIGSTYKKAFMETLNKAGILK